MNTKIKKESIPHEHKLILTQQPATGLFCVKMSVLGDYWSARRKSPEALQEFLEARKEQNRIEAENPPPVEPAAPPKPVLPALALNDTMVFMQKVAQDGVLLALNKNKQLTARGWRPVAKKWHPKVWANRGAIKETLLQISSTHGDTDPLTLRELAEDAMFCRACNRLRELEDMHGGFKAITLHSEEENAHMVICEFPEELAQ